MKNIPSIEAQQILIKKIIFSFYSKVTTDFLLGYHFKKIQEFEIDPKGHPLRPTMEAFSTHIPKINEFWCRQLLATTIDNSIKFDLINTHNYLSINKGELNRFQLLFREELELYEQELRGFELYEIWQEKLSHFVEIFIRVYFSAPTGP